jgi:hypothetical protein
MLLAKIGAKEGKRANTPTTWQKDTWTILPLEEASHLYMIKVQKRADGPMHTFCGSTRLNHDVKKLALDLQVMSDSYCNSHTGTRIL